MTDNPLVGVLLVTHGQLGKELVAATQTIVGEMSHITAVSIGWNDNVDESKARIEDAVLKLERRSCMALVKHQATLARIDHTLKTRKPLRN